jgi:hypothetical protein
MSNHDRHGQHVYGELHRKLRRRWARKVRKGGVCCWRCGKPIGPTGRWDLGHVDEAGLARGFPTRHPEHRACNRATLTHAKQRLAVADDRFAGLADPTPTNEVTDWSRHWYGPFNPRCTACRERGAACDDAGDEAA